MPFRFFAETPMISVSPFLRALVSHRYSNNIIITYTSYKADREATQPGGGGGTLGHCFLKARASHTTNVELPRSRNSVVCQQAFEMCARAQQQRSCLPAQREKMAGCAARPEE